MAKERTIIEIKLDNSREVMTEEYLSSVKKLMAEKGFEPVIRHINPHSRRAINRDVVLKINKF